MKKICFVILLISPLLFIGCIERQDLEKGVDEVGGEIKEGAKEAQPYIEEGAKQTEREAAIIKAKNLFLQLKMEGKDFSDGPCIDNNLMPGWVADVAHNPRQAVDNDPGNQCSNYSEGKAQHFVELDTEGELIKAK